MDENMFDLRLDIATISADLPDPVITLSGADSYTVQDTANYPLLVLNLYGESVQDGTPTPDAPVDIVSVGDDGNVSLTTCGKNFVQYSNASTGYGGITFTLNSDNSITVNGTATSLVNSSAMSTALLLPNGDYIVSGCAEGGTSDTYKLTLRMYKSDGTSKYVSVTKETKITIDDSITKILLYCEIYEGITANNLVFKPMIRLASITDNAYEPYTGNTATITSGLPLCSVGDVRDELIYNADGTGKIIKRTHKWTITSDAVHTQSGWSTADRLCIFTIPKNNGQPAIREEPDALNILCDKLKRSLYAYSPDTYIIGHNGDSINYAVPTSAASSVDELKTWLDSNPITVLYILAEPYEIELSTNEMAALMQLHTFNGTTNIYNDENAEMKVKVATNPLLAEYVKPVIDGITAKFEERIAALEAAITNN